jgi:tRNA(Arg) A34 adenosine deaminase TadA
MAEENTSESYMRHAISLAESAKSHGNHPFGALLELDGKVVLTAENTVITDKNFTKHAEFNLMDMVAKSELSREEIKRCTLYTSTEPCPMCSGAIFWGGVRHVVYGCPCEVLGQIAGDDFLVPCRTLFAKSITEVVTVEGPVLADEARVPHVGFWDAHS